MSLPGNLKRLSNDTTERCDDHPDRKAAYRLTGETDSFGSEYYYQCTECNEGYRKHMAEAVPEEECCDWCSTMAVLSPTRDYDEGMNGRVYYVCGACKKKQSDDAAAELAEYDQEHAFDDGWI